MTAKKIKPVNEGSRGDQVLYRVDPPLEGFEWVVVSATNVEYSGPETYIFGADAKGNITEWGELDGSYKGGLNHELALENAGYSVEA